MSANVKQATIKPLVTATIESGALVYTDEYVIYSKLPEWGYGHKSVCHGNGQYVRDEDGDGFHEVHVNTMAPWKGFGRYCAPGCALTGVYGKKSYRCIWGSSNVCITSEDVAKRLHPVFWRCCLDNTPKSTKSLQLLNRWRCLPEGALPFSQNHL